MVFLYDLGIRLMYMGIWLAASFNSKARLWIDGRKGLLDRIEGEVNSNDFIIWFHAASLGEFEQGRPIIEAWKERSSRNRAAIVSPTAPTTRIPGPIKCPNDKT